MVPQCLQEIALALQWSAEHAVIRTRNHMSMSPHTPRSRGKEEAAGECLLGVRFALEIWARAHMLKKLLEYSITNYGRY